MTSTSLTGGRRGRRSSRSAGLRRLRCAYFACGSDSAARYGLSFECVVQHLWQARAGNRRLRLRQVRHIDDLVHAAACAQGLVQAWFDLAERYERALARRCRETQEEIQATMFVRRLFADLRRRTAAGLHAPPSLCSYSGVKPMRSWLNDRMNALRRSDWAARIPCCGGAGCVDPRLQERGMRAVVEGEPPAVLLFRRPVAVEIECEPLRVSGATHLD